MKKTVDQRVVTVERFTCERCGVDCQTEEQCLRHEDLCGLESRTFADETVVYISDWKTFVTFMRARCGRYVRSVVGTCWHGPDWYWHDLPEDDDHESNSVLSHVDRLVENLQYRRDSLDEEIVRLTELVGR